MAKQYKQNKLTHIEVMVVVLACLFFLACIGAALCNSRSYSFRIECARNLSEIGKAMLIYANDYEDELPRAGGRNTAWGRFVNWDAPKATPEPRSLNFLTTPIGIPLPRNISTPGISGRRPGNIAATRIICRIACIL